MAKPIPSTWLNTARGANIASELVTELQANVLRFFGERDSLFAERVAAMNDFSAAHLAIGLGDRTDTEFERLVGQVAADLISSAMAMRAQHRREVAARARRGTIRSSK